MNDFRMVFLVIMVLMLSFATMTANANLYLDEDFEGATAFQDNNWPYQDYTVPASPSVQSAMGINLLAYSPSYAATKVNLGTKEGTVTSSRRFLGQKSYQLAGTQKLAVAPGGFPTRHTNWYRVWQFAVSTDGASAAKPAGTVIGHFKVDYTLGSTTSFTPEGTYRIELVSNGGGVDIKCTNNNTKIGSLTGASGNWALITVIEQCALVAETSVDSPQPWECNDESVTPTLYKGPSPINITVPASTTADDYFKIPTGVSIYVNSKETPATVLTRADQLTSAWGYSDVGGVTKSSPVEIGWEFGADNGGTIYIDDFYWSGGGFNGAATAMWKEYSRRINEFNTPTTEPAEIIAGAANWMFY